jgi:hypothetical protein
MLEYVRVCYSMLVAEYIAFYTKHKQRASDFSWPCYAHTHT